jgi:hypothetical protein
MPDEHPRCDQCGQPATNRAFDIIRHEGPENHGFVRFAPVGGAKYGCDEHPAESETYRSNPSLLRAMR